MEDINITKKFIEVLFSPNLMEELRNEFLTEEEQEQECDIDVKTLQYEYYADSSSVNIDKIMSQLNKLKESGCSHVSIDFHCDHDEYELYGYSLERESEQERTARIELEEEKKRKKKEQEIANLEAKLNKLKNN